MFKIKATVDEQTCPYCKASDGLEITNILFNLPPLEGCTRGDEEDEFGNLIKQDDRCRCVGVSQ